MTPDTMDALWGLLAKATPGPWTTDTGGETSGLRDSEGGRLALCTHLRGPHGEGGRRDPDEVNANAALIVAAVNALPAPPLNAGRGAGEG